MKTKGTYCLFEADFEHLARGDCFKVPAVGRLGVVVLDRF